MWFVKKGSMVGGPISDADFKAMVASHQISMTDLVSEDGRIWKRFGTIDFGARAARPDAPPCLPDQTAPYAFQGGVNPPCEPNRPGGDASPGQAAAFAPTDVIADTVGVERLKGFSLVEFFSQVFKHHTRQEVEEIFSCGSGPRRTNSGWPMPWLFGRLFLTVVIAYAGLCFGYSFFDNTNFLPGLIFMGSFAVPLATLILFFELNVCRDVSIIEVFKCFLLGGVLSLVFAMFLFRSPPGVALDKVLNGPDAGIVEEIAKVAALVCLSYFARSRRILGGMLLGAAVGAGFAAFESSGYALNNFRQGGYAACMDNIHTRGLLAPFGHVVWTAIAGGALWRVWGDHRFRFAYLVSGSFLRVIWLPMVLHMVWNSSFLAQSKLRYVFKYGVIGVIAWAVVFSLVQEGLRQAQSARRGALASTPAQRQTIGSMALAVLAFVAMTFFTGFLITAGGAFFNRVVLPLFSGS